MYDLVIGVVGGKGAGHISNIFCVCQEEKEGCVLESKTLLTGSVTCGIRLVVVLIVCIFLFLFGFVRALFGCVKTENTTTIYFYYIHTHTVIVCWQEKQSNSISGVVRGRLVCVFCILFWGDISFDTNLILGDFP